MTKALPPPTVESAALVAALREAGAADVAAFGRCVLAQGDCLRLLPALAVAGVTVTGLVTDPPYSSGGLFRGDRTGVTSTKYQSTEHRGAYAEFSGDNRDQRAFAHWSALWLGLAREACAPGALAAVFTDWRQLPTTTDAVQAGGWVWRGLVPWDKTEAVRPQLGRFRNQCEYVVWGTNGPAPLEGPVVPGVVRAPVQTADKTHITEKPVAVLAHLLRLAGPVVLDPFFGSGSTGEAALRLGRAFVGFELEPAHFANARTRLERATLQRTLTERLNDEGQDLESAAPRPLSRATQADLLG